MEAGAAGDVGPPYTAGPGGPQELGEERGKEQGGPQPMTEVQLGSKMETLRSPSAMDQRANCYLDHRHHHHHHHFYQPQHQRQHQYHLTIHCPLAAIEFVVVFAVLTAVPVFPIRFALVYHTLPWPSFCNHETQARN